MGAIFASSRTGDEVSSRKLIITKKLSYADLRRAASRLERTSALNIAGRKVVTIIFRKWLTTSFVGR
jgi:hypothetical protein